MSLKSLFQIIIFLIIIVVLGSVYFNYFLESKIKIEKVEKLSPKKIEITPKDNSKNENIKNFENADKIQQNYQASELARQARLEQVENNLRKAQQQVSGLTITAGISGIVQKLPIELGQQLNSGENAALVIDPASLLC